MSLKILLLLCLLIQVLLAYHLQEFQKNRGIIEEVDEIVHKLKNIIIEGFNEMQVEFNGFYVNLSQDHKDELSAIKVEVDRIYEERKQKLKDLRDDAKAMGLEIVDCVMNQGESLFTAYENFDTTKKNCSNKAMTDTKFVWRNATQIAGEAAQLIGDIITEWQDCEDLVCYIQLVQAHSGSIEAIGIDIKTFFDNATEQLTDVESILNDCNNDAQLTFDKKLDTSLSDLLKCVNSVHLAPKII